MNLIRKCLLTVIIPGLVTPGFSQDNKEILKLSISEAQTYALQNNRSVQSSRIDIDIAGKKVWETIAMGLPQLNLATNYQHQFVVPQLSFGPYLDVNSLPEGSITKADILSAYKASPAISLGVKNNTTFDFTLSQLIFSGEYIVGLQATKVFKEISEKTLVKTEAQTKESVAGTYHLVLVLGENIRVLSESLKAIEQMYGDMVKMNRQGFNEETDVDQIKINKTNIQTLITSMESQKDVSVKLLKFQLGVDFGQEVILTDSLPGVINSGNMEYLTSPAFNVETSVDYQMISNLEKASALSLKREQSKVLPTLSAFYRRHEQLNTPAFNFAVKDMVGVSINVPIFSSGMRASKISQARFDLEKSKLNTENVSQSLIMEYESAMNSYKTAFSNFVNNRESMMLSKRVYDKTIIKQHEGVSSSFELTQNQNQFLTAESNYYSSVLSLLNAKAKLDRILSNNK
ncbi:MAG: TolC family protein [Bacteroidia bacterium]|nr:TolC family protein [Bacteroidia bacterium]